MTRKKYNDTQYPWERVKNHVLGIWHHANASLDLMQLHQELLDLQNSPPLAEGDLTTDFLQALDKALDPAWTMHTLVALGLGIAGLYITFIIVPCLLKNVVFNIRRLWFHVHSLQIRTGQPVQL